MYIQDLACISPQLTLDSRFLEGIVTLHKGNEYIALEPNYATIIPPGLLRRMGKAVRMGAGTALPLLQKHKNLEGIVIATSAGGIEDSMKFLDQIIKYEEGTLTPTHFVQSTPNSLAGLLALLSKNTGYNSTHSNKGLSFESAVQDTFLLLEEKENASFLLGSSEQFSRHNHNIETLDFLYKKEELGSENLLGSDTPGTVSGEGAAMFIVSNEPNKSIAQILDVAQITYPEKEELGDTLQRLLSRNGLQVSDIDALMLGYNGDKQTQFWYEGLVKEFFPSQALYSFKNLVGEYATASSFAVWLSAILLSGHSLPPESLVKPGSGAIQNLLIYNHNRGLQHGFILMRK